MTNPITPPPIVREQWQLESPFKVVSLEREDYMIDRAAQWGADQELEACIKWLLQKQIFSKDGVYLTNLLAARRPKPPSPKEQALQELKQLKGDANSMGMGFDAPAIRRALEALDD